MMKDSGVWAVTFGEFTGAGEFDGFSIDLEGLHSFDGGRALRSDMGFAIGLAALAKEGGLMYFVHGEKFTRFDCRLDGTPFDALVANGDRPGVCATTGESSVRSFSGSTRDDVLGGVGGRADKGP